MASANYRETLGTIEAARHAIDVPSERTSEGRLFHVLTNMSTVMQLVPTTQEINPIVFYRNELPFFTGTKIVHDGATIEIGMQSYRVMAVRGYWNHHAAFIGISSVIDGRPIEHQYIIDHDERNQSLWHAQDGSRGFNPVWQLADVRKAERLITQLYQEAQSVLRGSVTD